MGQVVVKSQQVPSHNPTKPQTTTRNKCKVLNLCRKSVLERRSRTSVDQQVIDIRDCESCPTSRGEDTQSANIILLVLPRNPRLRTYWNVLNSRSEHSPFVAICVQELLFESSCPRSSLKGPGPARIRWTGSSPVSSITIKEVIFHVFITLEVPSLFPTLFTLLFLAYSQLGSEHLAFAIFFTVPISAIKIPLSHKPLSEDPVPETLL